MYRSVRILKAFPRLFRTVNLMRAFHSTAISISVVLILATLSSSHVDAADESGSEVIAKISQNANKWRSHFATLNLKYKTSHFESWRKAHPDKTDDEIRGCYRHHELIWTDQASLRLEWKLYQFGKIVKRMVDGGNGQESFSASYIVDATGVERFSELRIVPVNRSHAKIPTMIEPLQILWHPGSGKWLDELITDESAELHGAEKNSDPIVDIRLESAGQFDDRFFRVRFDAERNLLPRSSELLSRKRPNAPGLHWECSEWREIMPGYLFPWKGKWGVLAELQDWEMEEVHFNVPVKPSMFVAPQPSRGTTILDGRSGQLIRYGMDAPRAQRAADSKSLAAENLRNLEGSTQLPLAGRQPSPATTPSGGLAIGSTLLLGIALFLWVRRRA